METNARRRLIVFTGIAVVVMVILVAAAAKLIGGGTAINTKVSAPLGLATAAAYGDHTAIASDGTKLVSYNYQTGTVRAVSSDAGLGVTDSLSASDDRRFVLFHTNFIAPDTVLDSTLQAGGLSVSQDYWWLFDAKTGTFRPLPAGTTAAKLSNSRVYGLTITPNGQAIVGYDAATLKQESSVSIIPSTDFAVASGGYVLQNADGNVYFTKDGVVNQQLAAKAAIVATVNNGQAAIVTDSQHRSLVQVSLQTGYPSTTLATGVAGPALWQTSGLVLYGTADSGGHYSIYNTRTHKTTAWRFTGDNYPGGNVLVLLDSTTAVIANTSNDYFITGKNLHSPVRL